MEKAAATAAAAAARCEHREYRNAYIRRTYVQIGVPSRTLPRLHRTDSAEKEEKGERRKEKRSQNDTKYMEMCFELM